jgi:hypothetical protein
MPKLRSEAHIIGTGKRQNDQKRGFLAPVRPDFIRRCILLPFIGPRQQPMVAGIRLS